jgi:hypothetical protein
MTKTEKIFAIAALALGAVGLAFGDNIYGRLTSAPEPEAAVAPAENSSPAAPPPAAEAPPIRNPEASPGSAGPPTLAMRLCSSRRIAVTFETRHKDQPRFRRRSGRNLIPVRRCDPATGAFETEMDSDGASRGAGLVVGDTVDFKFRYWDSEGTVDCRVVAKGDDPKLHGNIACEASGGELPRRSAVVEI